MSRPVRIEFPGAIYHITSKGSKGQTIFRDREDRAVFLNTLDNVVSRFSWLVHSYVLMDEHFHLVVEIPEANLSKGMRQLNGVYTQHFNRRHDEDGPIFQGRFKSVLFEKSSYLLPVCRHVVLNPVRVGAPSQLNRYRWSSFRATAGYAKTPSFLHTSDLLAGFSKREKVSRRKFREYVGEGIDSDSPLLERSNQVLLGSAKFIREMQPILQGEKMAKRGPKQARRRRSLSALFRTVDSKTRAERNELIRRAHLDYGYTLMDIGQHLGLHYTTVSKVVNAGIENRKNS
ncbi:MAG TPA: addiction module toxin RelE [Gammaproteobacteria bacterium]|nr:addiction module toxin RelE [Gammaproteobacteria bacterium]|tara:strand:+ start:2014 stop:2877 length:864 start_codon:yes stop_codon:yes gene_type:complete